MGLEKKIREESIETLEENCRYLIVSINSRGTFFVEKNTGAIYKEGIDLGLIPVSKAKQEEIKKILTRYDDFEEYFLNTAPLNRGLYSKNKNNINK